MFHKLTATALVALFSLLANGAWGHDYYPEQITWSKHGTACVLSVWVKDPPAINGWVEAGQRVKELGANWCVAKQSVSSSWSAKNIELQSVSECLGQAKYTGSGPKILQAQENRGTNKFWNDVENTKGLTAIRVAFEPQKGGRNDIRITDNDPTHYSNGDPVRYLVSVFFWTGSNYHHHSGYHSYANRVDGICQ